MPPDFRGFLFSVYPCYPTISPKWLKKLTIGWSPEPSVSIELNLFINLHISHTNIWVSLWGNSARQSRGVKEWTFGASINVIVTYSIVYSTTIFSRTATDWYWILLLYLVYDLQVNHPILLPLRHSYITSNIHRYSICTIPPKESLARLHTTHVNNVPVC